MDKIVRLKRLKRVRSRLRKQGQVVVFTNGCFDIIHRGHVEYLKKARSYGDFLIVAVNSDSSVRKLKGKGRPLVSLEDRLFILAHFPFVDLLLPFDEETPREVIKEVLPDVLVKGSDYKKGEIIGADLVEKHGGKVVTVSLVKGKSSSGIIKKIVERYCQ
jgi:rfaE bifunctional protein nucleotidyltransferase chain/domain